MIHIVIPAVDHQKKAASDSKSSLLGLAWMTSFGLSDTFTNLHLTIKSIESKISKAYTITYSSGER